jgi:hypothetical protein
MLSKKIANKSYITFAIWLPVNLSWALLPVISARVCEPPMHSSSSIHSLVVEESCQIGALGFEKAPGNSCEVKVDWVGSRDDSIVSASFDQ